MGRSGRLRATVALVAALGTAVAATSSASGSPLLRPPAGSPDPKAMVLVSKDLGGAKVSHQGYFKDSSFPSVISYEREFDESRVASTVMIDVDSQAEIGTSAASTTRFYASMRRLFGTRAFQAELKKQLVKDFGSSFGLVSHPQVGRPHNLGVG